MKKLFQRIGSSPMWLMLPTLVVAGMVAFVVVGYNPLSFDPALANQAQENRAAGLKMHDAEEEATGATVTGSPAVAGTVAKASAPQANGLKDGTWTGYAVCGRGNPDNWKPYYVAVTIEVKNGKVKRIVSVQGTSKADSGATLSWDAAENQSYLNWAISGHGGSAGTVSQINALLSANKSVSGVDTVSGATYSSVAIYNAYVAAVNKAAKAGGQKATKKAKKTTKKKKAKKTTPKKITDGSGSALAGKSLADGTWVGYDACGIGNDEEWNPYYVRVTVVVKDGKVTKVEGPVGTSTGEAGAQALNWSQSENGAYLDWAAHGRTRSGVQYTGVMNQIAAALNAGAYPSTIDVVSGATYSAESIFRAFYAALNKAAEAGGTSIDQPTIPETDDTSGGDGSSSGGSGDDPGDGGSQSGGDGSGESGGQEGGGSDPDEPQTKTVLVDGNYSAYAFCKDLDSPSTYSPYYIIVEIQVADGRVSKIVSVQADSSGSIDSRYRYDSSENSTYLDFAINGVGRRVKGMVEKIQEKIDAGQDASSVDVVSSATWSSLSILEAYNKAVASVPTTTIQE